MENRSSKNELFGNLKVGLVHVVNPTSVSTMNKDLNGGFGTKDHYGPSFTSKILQRLKKQGVRLPVISLAYLQAIFKGGGAQCTYFEGALPDKNQHFDLLLVYGSIVDFRYENQQAEVLKKNFPNSVIGFVGPFPTTCPDLFSVADFVLAGEPEAFFMNEFQDLSLLKGIVKVQSITDMEALPTPDFDGFPIQKYNYRPMISKTPFLVLQASRGCPYSCRFYCVYGEAQGAKVRQRSAKKIADDIELLQKKYGIKGLQFRDPLFGVKKSFINELVIEIKQREIKLEWGMETRLDLLTEENLSLMYNAGLRSINVGIETFDAEIAKNNKRLLVEELHQNRIVSFCKEKGIRVSAFYILGMEGDTEETMNHTLQYAIRLKTTTARFSVSTPYPGTGYYHQLQKENRLLTNDLEAYDQFTLVYKHEYLSPQQVDRFMDKAYRSYYFRLSYISMMIREQVTGLFGS